MAARKSEYQTRQRSEILAVLKSHAGSHYTVAALEKELKRSGLSVGTTTIYRQLEKLTEEGVVAKYLTGAGTPACFEYLLDGIDGNFHARCIKCGTLIHIRCDELTRVERHLLEKHHYWLDKQRTVLYGLCEKCQEEEEKAKRWNPKA
ncbi:MAG: transcriptional repressor [Sphaerochaetaceae bacterium]|nr:transcriptional repressor [Spirochaetales bacterium]MDY5500471.1 transcriptional repressor [Sphaerochaetaceae bacterium]